MPKTVFFSYSHDDESLRDQLEKHLAVLRHDGTIEAWHDRRIKAGAEFDTAIDKALEEADIILLLVSASFLHSPYCYSKEMKRAMERHEAGDAVVVPVIVRECDWHRAPFGKLLAAPRDGKAITSWANPDEAYADVARRIRALVDEPAKAPAVKKVAAARQDAPTAAPARARSSNLRLKKTFTDLEKDTFLTEAFSFIADYFEGSLAELSDRNPGVEGRFQRVDAQTFIATVYRGGKKQAACSVHLGGGALGSGIRFSHDTSARGNSFNEQLSVAADEHELYLRSMGMASWSPNSDRQKLSMTGGAELFWSMLIDHLR